MRRIVASCCLTYLVIVAAACGGEAAAASAESLDVQFEAPRSIGTPAAEVARISGQARAKRVVNPGPAARLSN
jgi:hypothetical protein